MPDRAASAPAPPPGRKVSARRAAPVRCASRAMASPAPGLAEFLCPVPPSRRAVAGLRAGRQIRPALAPAVLPAGGRDRVAKNEAYGRLTQSPARNQAKVHGSSEIGGSVRSRNAHAPASVWSSCSCERKRVDLSPLACARSYERILRGLRGWHGCRSTGHGLVPTTVSFQIFRWPRALHP